MKTFILGIVLTASLDLFAAKFTLQSCDRNSYENGTMNCTISITENAKSLIDNLKVRHVGEHSIAIQTTLSNFPSSISPQLTNGHTSINKEEKLIHNYVQGLTFQNQPFFNYMRGTICETHTRNKSSTASYPDPDGKKIDFFYINKGQNIADITECIKNAMRHQFLGEVLFTIESNYYIKKVNYRKRSSFIAPPQTKLK